ncbi:PASTA domain-containing protein [Neolewinella antarctica]|uniref:D-alanine--D-alanine ligase n=1 Tax=Neolewinella antarctica TaxID=442734 RepID=A0ABX0XFN5_9BACT|nr:PASTA domain-containing protein [Neolewinella antarctica]NJC27588.1 D-alanine-D-alanine ligase [Neolewinella antarctica]
MRIKVGIFFGGPSREREISFAGGRTVYDNLDQALFEPVPIFVDSFRKWHLLDWQYLYRGTIRDFFPPIDLAPASAHGFQVYQESLGPLDELSLEAMARKVGSRIRRHDLPELIDVAFLALHGEYGEDGQLQRELEYAGVPYTGSGVEASEIGMDKAIQKELMSAKGFASPALLVIKKGDFDDQRVQDHFYESEREIGWPMVIRPARQGSSIGVAILKESEGLEGFERAVNAAFFRELLPVHEYAERNEYERLEYVRNLSDLRDGVAFPMDAQHGERTITLYTPDELYDFLEAKVEVRGKSKEEGRETPPDTTEFGAEDETTSEASIAANRQSRFANQDSPIPHALPPTAYPLIIFSGHQTEQSVIVEAFIDGKEFSTIVLRTPAGAAVALPPTEIVKPSSELFDYRAKYMPGRSRKVTPIELPTDRIQAIRAECERLFEELGFHVYARIDGFHTASGEIFLNDPNTTSGMMPSSFFFHQAAEIGLNPSQFLTYIIRQSLRERGRGRGMQGEGMDVADELGTGLDEAMEAARASTTQKERIGVILGGPSFERHISVESGRNIYEKLASSEGYLPTPLFLEPDGEDKYRLHQLPINLLLKDNADDIRAKLGKTTEHAVVQEIREACKEITHTYAAPNVVFLPKEVTWKELPKHIDGAFIALHGRPGEDGQVQALLEPLGIYYNGSGIASSRTTIDKYKTLHTLARAGLEVTEQWLASGKDFYADEDAFYQQVEERFGYPHVAKPVDDGCSSAVLLIKDRQELTAYCHLTFRPTSLNERAARKELKVSEKDEWPSGKNTILFEKVITAEGADKFMEITGGMLTHLGEDGEVRYQIFEPSETLAGGEILSLEEKFLAGEGQNLTPARLATDGYSYDFIAGQVKADLEKAARAVAVEGYCRIDAFVRIYADGTADTIPIEVNSLPGMTPATAIFHQAALAGYQPAAFIDRILAYGKARRDRAAIALPTEAALSSVPSQASLASPKNPAPATAPLTEEKTAVSDYNALIKEGEESTVPPIRASSSEPEKTGFVASTLALLKSGYFWKNFAMALLFLVICFFLLRISLNLYTSHGSSTDLPNFVDMSRAEAAERADDLGLTLKFEKGAFDPNRPPGTVTRQHPKAGAGVKKNRSIYLTILTDEAPMIKLPPLTGEYDYTQYTTRLQRMGEIRSKIREQVYDGKQEENTILYLYYGDRKITEEELRGGRVEVPKGGELEFVVTVRETGEVSVPKMRCRTFGELEFLLDGSDLLVGKTYGDVANRSNAYVVRTEPSGGAMVPVGSKFDVYLSDTRPGGCD